MFSILSPCLRSSVLSFSIMVLSCSACRPFSAQQNPLVAIASLIEFLKKTISPLSPQQFNKRNIITQQTLSPFGARRPFDACRPFPTLQNSVRNRVARRASHRNFFFSRFFRQHVFYPEPLSPFFRRLFLLTLLSTTCFLS